MVYRETQFLLLLFLTFKTEQQPLQAGETCDIAINDCEYKLSLSPSNSCHGSSRKEIRMRRASSSQTDHVQPNNTLLLSYMRSLHTKADKHQHKLTREMRNLSKRVLRGVRKLETLVDDLDRKKSRDFGKGVCPPGFTHLKGWPYCYLFSRFNTTWYEARDYCNAFDSDMVSLGSLKEHYVVTFLIKNHPEYSLAEGWWTSGAYITKTKQWMWTSAITMEPFTFVKWALNEPNEVSLQCVLMYGGDNHLWHDRLCTDKYNFVCEAPIKEA